MIKGAAVKRRDHPDPRVIFLWLRNDLKANPQLIVTMKIKELWAFLAPVASEETHKTRIISVSSFTVFTQIRKLQALNQKHLFRSMDSARWFPRCLVCVCGVVGEKWQICMTMVQMTHKGVHAQSRVWERGSCHWLGRAESTPGGGALLGLRGIAAVK